MKVLTIFSRPRRFGKSLMIDTLKCLFEGKKHLFENLFIYDKWNWNQQYPVIRISFGLQKSENASQLKEFILNLLNKTKPEQYQVSITGKYYYEQFF